MVLYWGCTCCFGRRTAPTDATAAPALKPPTAPRMPAGAGHGGLWRGALLGVSHRALGLSALLPWRCQRTASARKPPATALTSCFVAAHPRAPTMLCSVRQQPAPRWCPAGPCCDPAFSSPPVAAALPRSPAACSPPRTPRAQLHSTALAPSSHPHPALPSPPCTGRRQAPPLRARVNPRTHCACPWLPLRLPFMHLVRAVVTQGRPAQRGGRGQAVS